MPTDFVSALAELNAQFGIPLEELLSTVEGALAAAYRRAFDPPGEIRVHLDPETASLQVTSRSLSPAGEMVVEELPVDDFRRLAAQTARTAVMRRIRELERDQVLREVSERRGELASGVVDRIEGGTAYIDVGRAEGVMPPEEQIPGEVLQPGKPVNVVLLEARRAGPNAQVRVSRASRLFVQKLLEAEVPEIGSGAVSVKAIAREPGVRTKVAVHAEQAGIDPRGACIGPRGVRHRALLSELSGEHVDFVEWSDDTARFVGQALGPATVEDVRIDRASRTATVLVPRSQLSLAIGKDGQNARLAAKLTGWRIDIKAAEDVAAGAEPGGGQAPA